MDFKKYNVIITPKAYKELIGIYDYIVEEFYAEKTAKDIIRKIIQETQKLQYLPYRHTEIGKKDEQIRRYRKVIVKNYVIIYIIDEKNKTVVILHIYYAKRDYLNRI